MYGLCMLLEPVAIAATIKSMNSNLCCISTSPLLVPFLGLAGSWLSPLPNYLLFRSVSFRECSVFAFGPVAGD